MQIAGYRLEAEIGRGAMATVYLALDVRLDRTVAVKILPPSLRADQEFATRFISEIRAAALVDHPNIIPVYDAGETDGSLFIAMRYVRSRDVRRLLRTSGPLSAYETVAIMEPIAGALDTVHMKGIVHRDVKPSNILLDWGADDRPHPYLADFGLSKQLLLSGPGPITGPGLQFYCRLGRRSSLTGSRIIGTPDYVAPEQALEGAASERADQYSLACTTFELLSGRPPFSGPHFLAVISAHRSRPVPRLTDVRPRPAQGHQ